ncbi:DinB family protein [Flaviramulus aquimarinus]|uniref:DinB family protein n=1 Tax=Flaviramulus aquimarinus TaxID=1170456 RepID=A0ABP9F860_9FLAO
MELKAIIQQLENNQKVFQNLLSNKTESQYLWRPKPKKWCLLEIVCHLLDEECEDFRTRVKHALETPSKALTPINPEGWVVERVYISKNYEETLKAFLLERDTSIKWLKSLNNKNWKHAVKHPELGELSAKLFLTNWLAHDYLHIRQILRYQYGYLKGKSGTSLLYAGDW